MTEQTCSKQATPASNKVNGQRGSAAAARPQLCPQLQLLRQCSAQDHLLSVGGNVAGREHRPVLLYHAFNAVQAVIRSENKLDECARVVARGARLPVFIAGPPEDVLELAEPVLHLR